MNPRPLSSRGRPAVFFDRDGIVNRSPGAGYVERAQDFHILPGFLAALRVARQRGYAAVIVTNQRGVALGLVPPEELDAMHERLRATVKSEGLELLDIRICTANDNSDPRRKPNPGMLLEAAEEHGIDLTRSWMIGDSERDIEAGRRAGCAVTVRVGPPDAATAADLRAPDMDALAALLEERLPPAENI